MNLISYSIKTKGVSNFIRRLWTVFTRFSIFERKTARALLTLIGSLQEYKGAPTLFIPASVLHRHSALITQIANSGAEIGIHGYFHNDYRLLSKDEQYMQTKQAISEFQNTKIQYQGFRNPYLGWTEESLDVFAMLHFIYDSNEAVLHEVVDLDSLPPVLRKGYQKSLELFQAIPCSAYTLRPHFEGNLLRITTSIPDDEMLFDRLRADAEEVGRIWCKVMQSVYDLGGVYTLNLHPERAISCKQALLSLLTNACNRPLPVWLARLDDIAHWWKERLQFQLHITREAENSWHVEAICTSRATLLARNLMEEDQASTSWFGPDKRLQSYDCIVNATQCPCIGLSPSTPQCVADFLHEQGYPAVYSSPEENYTYALYLDIPEGLGTTREEQIQQRSALVLHIEALEAPFLHFGCWPDGSRAALAISGDIDSITVQDFFLRILEVR